MTYGCEYVNVRRVVYDPSGATFVPVCMKCHRFVRADDEILVSEARGLSPDPNATCKRCGRTTMHFEGFVS